MAAIQKTCARAKGGGVAQPPAVKGPKVMAPEDWASLAARWRAGETTASLAKGFGLEEARVISRLKPLMDARAGCAAAFDGAEDEVLVSSASKPEFVRAPEAEASEQRERDEAHWRAALEAGGFVSWTEGRPKRPRLNPPLSRPLIPAPVYAQGAR